MSWPRVALIAVAAVVYGALAALRWTVLGAAVVTVTIVILVAVAYAARPSQADGQAHGVWLAFTLIAFGPFVLGLLIFAITPAYFRPLYTSSVGEWILGALALAVAATHGFVHLGVRLVTRNRHVFGGTMLAIAVPFWGLTFLLILLGPAVAILSLPRRV